VDVSPAKEEVRKMLDHIPDDAAFQDIHYHIIEPEDDEELVVIELD